MWRKCFPRPSCGSWISLTNKIFISINFCLTRQHLSPLLSFFWWCLLPSTRWGMAQQATSRWRYIRAFASGLFVAVPITVTVLDRVAYVARVEGASMQVEFQHHLHTDRQSRDTFRHKSSIHHLSSICHPSSLLFSVQPFLNPDSGRDCDIVLLNRWSVRNYEVQRGDIVSMLWVTQHWSERMSEWQLTVRSRLRSHDIFFTFHCLCYRLDSSFKLLQMKNESHWPTPQWDQRSCSESPVRGAEVSRSMTVCWW